MDRLTVQASQEALCSERERERVGCLNCVAPTCPALCCRGAGCFSNVGTYLPGTVLQGCGCISGVGTYLPGTVLHAVMQAV